MPPSFSRKISALNGRGSRKHSLFSTFSLVLRMGQVFNITNIYQFPNQSAKNLYFHPRDFTYLLYISPYRRIQDLVEHLRWIFLQKQLTATQENNSIIFAKSSILDSSILDVRMDFLTQFFRLSYTILKMSIFYDSFSSFKLS